MRKSIFIIFLFVFSSQTQAQIFDTIVYKGQVYFTIPFDTFFSPRFTIPDSVPDGQWLILTKRSKPRYIFNTRENNIHGSFIEFNSGFIQSKGNYFKDSLWTFRFSTSDNNRFKEGPWTYSLLVIGSPGIVVGVETRYTRSENLWYPDDTKKYEVRNGIERWYHPNGILQRTLTQNKIDKGEIIHEDFFDEFGNKTKHITTITTTTYIKKVRRTGVLVSKNTIEYNDSFRTKELLEDDQYITTILYGDVGDEIDRRRQKKKR